MQADILVVGGGIGGLTAALALIGQALARYQAERAPHAARVQRTVRTWGDIWHVDGVGALLRDELFRRASTCPPPG
ncbi:MAG TPA: hypothetical protein VMK84_01585 [Streptosporangiaceae bacterium]|nr:hypothetical protein [Streptosporangiaceae bacterium]